MFKQLAYLAQSGEQPYGLISWKAPGPSGSVEDRVPVSGVTAGAGRRDPRRSRIDQVAAAGNLMMESSLSGAMVSRLM
jgi:hypothetical protein